MRRGHTPGRAQYTRNLLILHTQDHQALSDWQTVKEKIEVRAPEIEVQIDSNDSPSAGIGRWQVTRPSLVFSPFRLLAYRPQGGKVYAGREMGKIAEWQRMVECGLPVPRTARLVPELRLRPEVWGEYVIVKPVAGLRGREVRLIRTSEVVRRFAELTHNARRRMLIQEFIDNVDDGNHPTSYRALTMFGKPLSLRALAWVGPRRPLAEIAGDPLERIASNDEEVATQDRLIDTPDVLALAGRVAQGFSEIPCLGQDIVRRAGTGELFILETNPGGAVWHLSSAAYRHYHGHDAAHMKERYDQFNALDVVAEELIVRTRAEAL